MRRYLTTIVNPYHTYIYSNSYPSNPLVVSDIGQNIRAVNPINTYLDCTRRNSTTTTGFPVNHISKNTRFGISPFVNPNKNPLYPPPVDKSSILRCLVPARVVEVYSQALPSARHVVDFQLRVKRTSTAPYRLLDLPFSSLQLWHIEHDRPAFHTDKIAARDESTKRV